MEKKRFGKQLQIELTATILENGEKRIVVFSFPEKGKFERPRQVLFHVCAWFLMNFQVLDWFDCLLAGTWFDSREKNSIAGMEKVKAWVMEGAEKEMVGRGGTDE